ncbi:palmitoyl-acyl carrier protein thioesterase, chloroplastic-like [Rutidosis leptorrhynchoides]|uniref:palmitoyl-acyl carrier protein thioesterase, chloroplastic-like n=1 Tax=Rutidosis leptorrhynchoides TaxID=125765 RepID=UPI003A99FAA8
MASICVPTVNNVSTSQKTTQNFNTKAVNERLTMSKRISNRGYRSLRASYSEPQISIKTLKRYWADRHRQWMPIEGGAGYRQIFTVRVYDIGPHRNATIECILNLLQDTSINHLRTSGISEDETGVSMGMLRHNLVWFSENLTVEIDNYPCRDDVLEVDTWITPFGNNEVQKHWTIRNFISGKLHARAMSLCMMRNEKTGSISEIPEEIRDKISHVFLERKKVEQSFTIENINKLPERSDIGMNKHVKYVKYVDWMVEAMPEQILKNYQLSSMTLQYKRECGASETIQSLCEPDMDNEKLFEITDGEYKFRKDIFSSYLGFTHLLEVEGDHEYNSKEIVRGRTTWIEK